MSNDKQRILMAKTKFLYKLKCQKNQGKMIKCLHQTQVWIEDNIESLYEDFQKTQQKSKPKSKSKLVYIYIYIWMYLNIQREGERDTHTHIHIYIYTYIYIYIHI